MIIDNNALSLEERVFRQLEEEILSGELRSGESLTEISLSARLGVSRTPVRAALHRLSEEGLIKTTPNRGAVVIGVSESDLEDTYRIRMRLEGLASAMATERLTEDDLKELTEQVELSEYYISKCDTKKLGELDSSFHRVIYRASGNRMLGKILTELHRNIKSYRRRSLDVPGRLESSVKEHRQILEAMKRGDSAEADRLTSLHVRRAMENLLGKAEE